MKTINYFFKSITTLLLIVFVVGGVQAQPENSFTKELKTALFSETFESVPPTDWLRKRGLLTESTVFTSTYSSWSADGFCNDGYSGSARLNLSTYPRSEWLISPAINLGDGSVDYRIKIDVGLTSYSGNTATELSPDDTIAIVISTDGGTTWSSSNIIKEWVYGDAISNSGDQVIIELKDSNGINYSGDVMFGFYGESTGEGNNLNIYFDNFIIEQIPTGAAIALNTEVIDFGLIASSTTETRSITIANQGVADLVIDGVVGDVTPFSCNINSTIAPGESTTVDIAFNPSSTGQYTDTIEFNVTNVDWIGSNKVAVSGSAFNGDYELQSFENAFPPVFWSIREIQHRLWKTTSLNAVHESTAIYLASQAVSVKDGKPYVYESSKSMLVTPKLELGVDPTFSFYAMKSAGEGNMIHIKYSLDGETFSELPDSVGIIELTGTHTYYSIDLSGIPDDYAYIGIYGESADGTYASIYLDLVLHPSIYIPAEAPGQATNVSPINNAEYIGLRPTLKWGQVLGATGYALYFGTEASPVLPTDWNNLPEGWTDLGDTIAYNLPEGDTLDFLSEYYWMVVPYNSYGYAESCPVWGFTTKPNPVHTVPFFEAFGTASFPPYAWEKEEGYLTETSSLIPSTYIHWWEGGFGNVGEDGAARGGYFGNAIKHWLMTPVIDLGDGTTDYRLEFDLALTVSDTTLSADFAQDDVFAVVISTDGGETWSNTNILADWGYGDSISNVGEHVVIPLKNVDDVNYSGEIQIGFYTERTVTSDNIFVFIDNVSIDEVPPGAHISLSNSFLDFGFSQVGSSSKELSVNVSNTGFEPLIINGIEGDFASFTCNYVDTIAVGESSEIMISYYPAEVEVFVDSLKLNIIGDNWTGNAKFAVSAVTYPESYLTEGFENEVPPTYWSIVDGQYYNWIRSSSFIQQGNYSASLSSYNLSNWESSKSTLVTPEILLDTVSHIHFYARSYGSDNNSLKVMYSTNGVDFIDIPNGAGEITLKGYYTPFSVDLTEIPAEHCFIGFFGETAQESFSYVLLDHVVYPPVYLPEEAPQATSLDKPSNTADNLFINLKFEWKHVINTTGYKVYLREGDNLFTEEDVVADTDLDNFSITWLNYSTEYFWKVVPYNAYGEAIGNEVWSFTTMTEQPISEFPYFEGFEHPYFNIPWMSSKWFISQSNPHAGLRSAGTTMNHEGEATLVMPRIIIPEEGYEISFYWNDNDYISGKSSGHDTTFLEISYDNGVEWVTIDTLSDESITQTYTKAVHSLPVGSFHLRWRDVNDGSLFCYGSAIDNISIYDAVPIIALDTAIWDAGQVAVGSDKSSENTYQISNTGYRTLVISSISDLSNTDFTTTFDESITLEVGESYDFTFNYAPQSMGVASAIFTIDAGEAGSVDISLHGEGINAVPEFTSTPVIVGMVGNEYTYNIEVSDANNTELTITGTLPEWLTLTDNGDGTAILSGTPVEENTFAVMLTVTDGEASANQNFVISVQPNSISEIGNHTVVYPNPVRSILNITNVSNAQITIFDISGSVLYSNVHNDTNIEINLSDYEAGTYFVTISDKKRRSIHKIVVLD